MKTSALRATAVACLAGTLVAVAPVASGATIRIEGGGATLLPETAAPASGPAAEIADAFDGDRLTVPGTTATAQLFRATGPAGLPVGFDLFDFGSGPTSFITRIGPDAMPASFSPSWRVTVNHTAAQVGADQIVLGDEDRVVWAFVEDFAARELDLAVSTDVVERGRPFEVTVSSHATDGTATPAVGATVVYAGVTRTAGTGGRVTFTATGTGTQPVTATRAGEVRSPARAVCSTAGDPSVCGLTQPPAPAPPASPAPAPAGPQVSALADTVAPGSRIAFPGIGRSVRSPRAIAGWAGPDRSDVRRVEVALARRVGTQCRFVTARGALGPLTRCTARVWVRARSAGGNWIRPLRRPLAPGTWRVWSRAVDGAGNVESTGIARVNTGTFRVVAPRRSR